MTARESYSRSIWSAVITTTNRIRLAIESGWDLGATQEPESRTRTSTTHVARVS